MPTKKDLLARVEKLSFERDSYRDSFHQLATQHEKVLLERDELRKFMTLLENQCGLLLEQKDAGIQALTEIVERADYVERRTFIDVPEALHHNKIIKNIASTSIADIKAHALKGMSVNG